MWRTHFHMKRSNGEVTMSEKKQRWLVTVAGFNRNYNPPQTMVSRRIELPEDETFIIGQCYENEAATTLSCNKCGSKSFNVGQGTYYTAIKCINCDWQLCIHDG